MTKRGGGGGGKSHNVHTVPNANGSGWVNKVDGEVVSRHRTQGTAAERGREIAREGHTEHVIHRPTGEIREKNSYGNDPASRPG